MNLIEWGAEAVHDAWLAAKRAEGFTSRISEDGEELMVPYGELSEAAKDLDRNSVRASLTAVCGESWRIVRGHKIGTEAEGHPGEGGREVIVVLEEWFP